MKLTFLFFLIVISFADCAKILGIFPLPIKSHSILGSILLKELAKRGHEVTMISPFPLNEPPERYTDVDLSSLIKIVNPAMSQIMKDNQSKVNIFFKIIMAVAKLSRDIAEHEELHAFLKQGEKFDLVIQAQVMNEVLLGVGHSLNATTIGFCFGGSRSFLNYYTGNPAPYSYVPHAALGFSDNMSFIERVLNTLAFTATELAFTFLNLPYQQRLLDEFFPNAPPLQELIDNIDLTLLNSHVATETPRPHLPNVIQIGGFHLQENENLPADVETFLNSSKQGVVYFSLGTLAKSSLLSVETRSKILEAFRNIKYDVLWIYDDQLPNKPDNVMLTKWAPQKAVLAHQNVKAFITHAGLSGTVEAVYFGKPMICIPIFGDQYKNTLNSVSKGYAISIEKDEITKDLLINAINEIMDNPTYRNKIEIMSDLYRNQEMNPMDKAVFWVEHVLKHKGAKHLKAKAAGMPFYQYMLIDVVSFLLLILLLVIFISYYTLRFLFRLCFCKPKKLKSN